MTIGNHELIKCFINILIPLAPDSYSLCTS